MNDTTYKVLKLISGENIICEMSITQDGYEISRPLLMQVVPKFHEKGMTESLGLTLHLTWQSIMNLLWINLKMIFYPVLLNPQTNLKKNILKF